MYITEQPGWFDAMVEPFLYAMAALMTAAVPFFLVGRYELTRPHDAGLAATAALSFLPAFFAVFLNSLRNNAEHPRFESTIMAAPIEDSFGSTDRAESLNRERIRRLQRHVKFTNRAFYMLLCISAVWTAVHIASVHPRRSAAQVSLSLSHTTTDRGLSKAVAPEPGV
jgi:hypothetical protein